MPTDTDLTAALAAALATERDPAVREWLAALLADGVPSEAATVKG